MILGSCLLLGALTGCGDDNPAKPPNLQPIYVPSSTPQNTLQNLVQAYTHRDSTGYDSLFDASYAGTSYEPVTMNPLTFTKADEARHINSLAQTATISGISLNFPPVLNRDTDAADPPGWATISIPYFTLEIIDAVNSRIVIPGETMEYKFAPTAPSVGSPTDTTWHIVRWTELP